MRRMNAKPVIYAHDQVCTPAGLSQLVHHVRLIDTFRRPNEPAMTRIELGVHAQLDPILNVLGHFIEYVEKGNELTGKQPKGKKERERDKALVGLRISKSKDDLA